MHLHPSFEDFRALARGLRVIPVWREFLFDVDTAVTAYAKLARPPFGFLLESVVGGEQWARYSFLGTRPSGAWRLQEGKVSWWTPEGGWGDGRDRRSARRSRRTACARARRPQVPGLPALLGRGRRVFRIRRGAPHRGPSGRAARRPGPAGRDLPVHGRRARHRQPEGPGHGHRGRGGRAGSGRGGVARRCTTARAARSWRRSSADLATPAGPPSAGTGRRARAPIPRFDSSTTRADFEAGVERIREYIRAGDAFQVVLSQRLGVELDATPLRPCTGRCAPSTRRRTSTSWSWTGSSLVGSSPEVLVRVEDERGDRAPHRRHPPAGEDPRGGPGPGRRAGARTKRNWPSTACWWTWAATTWGGWPSTAR